MSDAKAKDQGDHHQAKPEVQPLQAPDAQTARLSGHVEMNRAEQARTNASDGSLRQYQPTTQAGRKLPADWGEQNRSIELQDGDVSISRVNPLKEANLANGDKRNANGKPYQVYTAEASQALQKPGEISKALTEGDYQERTKLNVQITNVPEVSPGVDPKEAFNYVKTVMDNGVAVVRQIESHMAQPNAINKDIDNTANHLKQSPFQFEKDVLGAFLGAVDKLDKPMSADQRAAAAGTVMPMFFFEGGSKPLDSSAVNQMKLDQMTAQQLKELGIERVEMNMPKVPKDFSDLELQKCSPELVASMESKGRQIDFARAGSEDLAALDKYGKEASSVGMHILLRENPHKIAALEEFLHGTQHKLGFFSGPEALMREQAEVHVKDFMIRHSKLLGLGENDLKVLESLKQMEIEALRNVGFKWKGK